MPADNTKIKVKLSTDNPELWIRQFPDGLAIWGQCEFIFNSAEKEYDWFVVYNDFPRLFTEEVLQCPASNTMLVTTEPPSIKSYGIDFTRQFGCVLTSQPEWSLPHSCRIFSQPALHWFFGWGSKKMRSYNEIASVNVEAKSKTISTVCSSKQQRHTLHNKRYQFTQALKSKLPEMDIFGHGVKLMDDKAESLDDYHYHLAIENYQGEHHWTEKLADSFLGLTLPFYFGCPNAKDYFPAQSFIVIDIFDLDGAYDIIQQAIKNNEYEKRLPYILEARRLVMEQYNIFAVLSREIVLRHNKSDIKATNKTIYSRHALRKKYPLVGLRDVIEKMRVRLISLLFR